MQYLPSSPPALLAAQYDLLALPSLDHVRPRFLPWSNSAMRPAAIQILLNDIFLNKRRSIVEFGSGISTAYLAAMLTRQGGQLISVDHDESWLQEVRNWLSPDEAAHVTFVCAPLRPAVYQGTTVEWYDHSAIERAGADLGSVDLVVVDGPPAYQHPGCLNRGPAAEWFRPRLKESALVVLDDIQRDGEQQIAADWSDLLACPHRTLAMEAGIACWKLGAGFNISH